MLETLNKSPKVKSLLLDNLHQIREVFYDPLRDIDPKVWDGLSTEMLNFRKTEPIPIAYRIAAHTAVLNPPLWQDWGMANHFRENLMEIIPGLLNKENGEKTALQSLFNFKLLFPGDLNKLFPTKDSFKEALEYIKNFKKSEADLHYYGANYVMLEGKRDNQIFTEDFYQEQKKYFDESEFLTKVVWAKNIRAIFPEKFSEITLEKTFLNEIKDQFKKRNTYDLFNYQRFLEDSFDFYLITSQNVEVDENSLIISNPKPGFNNNQALPTRRNF